MAAHHYSSINENIQMLLTVQRPLSRMPWKREAGRTLPAFREPAFPALSLFLVLNLNQDQLHPLSMFFCEGKGPPFSHIYPILPYPPMRTPRIVPVASTVYHAGQSERSAGGSYVRAGCCSSACPWHQEPCVVRMRFLCGMSNVACNLQERTTRKSSVLTLLTSRRAASRRGPGLPRLNRAGWAPFACSRTGPSLRSLGLVCDASPRPLSTPPGVRPIVPSPSTTYKPVLG